MLTVDSPPPMALPTAVDGAEPPAPSALDAAARVVRTRGADGRAIVWRAWGDAAAREAIVLMHGSYGSWTHWLAVIAPLAARYRVVVPDLPGFGDSDDAPDDRSPMAFARVLADGLDAARAELLGRAALVSVGGFSLGAVYAGWLARELEAGRVRGARLSRLVLVSPGGLGNRPQLPPPLARVRPEMDEATRFALHRENLAVVMFGDPARIDPVAVRVQDANVARARFRGRFTTRSDFLLEVLPQVRAPVLALWGDRDAFDADVRLRVASLLAARPDATTAIVAGAGHWLPYEAPAAFLRHLSDWMETRNKSI